ncbi:MAG: thioredoxin domain-containing protein [Tepidisphaeraceae bacterium]|jgi:protein-disulfide isomerase
MLNESESPTLSMPVSDRRDHIQGPATAAVTLVEYGDYQCPYCGEAYGVLKKLMPKLGDSARLVFRNFPLTQIHPHAEHAAEAAEAANAQGKFWKMHDILYERQTALEDEDLVSYAGEIGLDVARFQAELFERKFIDRIREDFQSGVRSGVNGTPTFFINGRRHDGPFDLQTLSEAVMMAMNSGQEARPHKHHRPQA